MLTFLKTAAAIACFIALVPLSVLAATGSWSRAREALKGYLTAMGVIVVVGAGAGLIAIIQLLT